MRDKVGKVHGSEIYCFDARMYHLVDVEVWIRCVRVHSSSVGRHIEQLFDYTSFF